MNTLLGVSNGDYDLSNSLFARYSRFLSYQVSAYIGASVNLPMNEAVTIPYTELTNLMQMTNSNAERYSFSIGLNYRPIF